MREPIHASVAIFRSVCRDHFAISVLSDEKSVAKGAAESKIKSGFGCPRSFFYHLTSISSLATR